MTKLRLRLYIWSFVLFGILAVSMAILYKNGINEIAHVIFILDGAALGVLLFSGIPFDRNFIPVKADDSAATSELSQMQRKALNIASCSLLVMLATLANILYLFNDERNSLWLYFRLVFLPYIIIRIVYYVLQRQGRLSK